ncbi:GNAT family N-acetyltransferase [Nonomuraea thailandensis]
MRAGGVRVRPPRLRAAAAGARHERHPSPIIDLRDGWDDYTESLRRHSGKTYKTTLAKSRKLQREAGPLRHDYATTDVEPLRTLLGWKTDQYRRTGRADRFAHPWIVELVERLLATQSDSFAGVLDMVYVDGRPMAGHFGLRTRTTLAGWFPAYDTHFAKYSPASSTTWRWPSAPPRPASRSSTWGGARRSTRTSSRTASWRWPRAGWPGSARRRACTG